MGPKNRLKQNRKFLDEWLNNPIDGYPARSFLRAHPNDRQKGVCIVCPSNEPDSSVKGKVFSIKEGWTAVTQHAAGKTHKERMEDSRNNPDHKYLDYEPKQLKIDEAVENLKNKNRSDDVLKNQIVRAETILASTIHSHGIPCLFFDCATDMVKRMFPDSKIAQGLNIARTKGTYLATHGIHRDLRTDLISKMKKQFFSLNFDESSVLDTSQLNVVVSVFDESMKTVVKRNFTTISMEEGTTAEEIVEAVFGSLVTEGINLDKLVFIATDGCSTMLGQQNGVHVRMRALVPSLPDVGGCPAHDCSNLLKHATKELSCPIVKIYQAISKYILGQSMHRWRKYIKSCEENGYKVSHPPKFIEVRFRSIITMAKWFEKDERAIYLFLTEELGDVVNGSRAGSETEQFIVENFLQNYIVIRLTTKFLIDSTVDLFKFLNVFEKEESRLHVRQKKIMELLLSFTSRSLKNSGLQPEEMVSIKTVLNMKHDDPELKLPLTELELGAKVEEFMKETGLERQSEVLAEWIQGVRNFYETAISRMLKYFTPALKSKFLRYCNVLDPKTSELMSTEQLVKQWVYLGSLFSNVIKPTELNILKREIPSLKFMDHRKKAMDFWNSVSEETDEDENSVFPLLSRLSFALLTIYNSSSAAERDFSIQVMLSHFLILMLIEILMFQNALVEDKHRNRTGQTLLQARLNIKSYCHSLKNVCSKCTKSDSSVLLLKKKKGLLNNTKTDKESMECAEDDEETEEEDTIGGMKHCHCQLFEPSKDLLLSLKSGDLYRRYREDGQKKKETNEVKKLLLENNREVDERKIKLDLKCHVQRMELKFQAEETSGETETVPRVAGKRINVAAKKVARERKNLKRKLCLNAHSSPAKKINVTFFYAGSSGEIKDTEKLEDVWIAGGSKKK